MRQRGYARAIVDGLLLRGTLAAFLCVVDARLVGVRDRIRVNRLVIFSERVTAAAATTAVVSGGAGLRRRGVATNAQVVLCAEAARDSRVRVYAGIVFPVSV